MNDVKVNINKELEALLVEARKHPVTAEQLRAQRQSIARAELSFGSDQDEIEYRAALRAKDTTTLERLDAEAAIRVAKLEQAT